MPWVFILNNKVDFDFINFHFFISSEGRFNKFPLCLIHILEGEVLFFVLCEEFLAHALRALDDLEPSLVLIV